MLSKNELRKLKCWGCWWQEGARCYNERIAEVVRNEEEHTQLGQEITLEFLETCEKKDRISKREVLGQYFDKDTLTILSEKSDLSILAAALTDDSEMRYNRDVDVLVIRFSDGEGKSITPLTDGIDAIFSSEDRLVGIVVQDASEKFGDSIASVAEEEKVNGHKQ